MSGHQLAVVLAQRHCHQSVSLGWHGLGSNMLLRTEESQGSKNQGRGKARSPMFDSKGRRITVGARGAPESPGYSEAIDKVTGVSASLTWVQCRQVFWSPGLRMLRGSLLASSDLSSITARGAPRERGYSRLLASGPLCTVLTSKSWAGAWL